MKALTIIQPWASLIVWREKRYETRSWPISYRGPVAIHAGISQSGRLTYFYYRDAFERQKLKFDDLPFGHILAVVDLVACLKTEDIRPRLNSQEKDMGDYSDGRYAWQLERMRILIEPIPARGYQGLWTWDRELESLTFKEAA